MRPLTETVPDEAIDRSRRRRRIAAVVAAFATATLAAVAAFGLGGAAAAALAGGLCGGLIGGWAGATLEPGEQGEDSVSHTVVTHERPGWRTIDLRDDRRTVR